MKIYRKLLMLNGGIIFLLVTAFCVIGYNILTNYGDETTQAALFTASKATQRFLDERIAMYSAVGRAISTDNALAGAVVENDVTFIKAYAQRVHSLEGISLVTIIDAETTVLARGHTDNAGDRLGSDRLIAAIPLKEGKAVFGIDTDSRSEIVLTSGTPLLFGGQPVGVVILGLNFSSDTFVDSIKKNFDVECTIFLDDIRYATTVIHDGISVLGTRLDNKYIYNKVMNGGETLIARNKIAGKEYDTIYWPWEDLSGKKAGMFFIGQSRAELKNSQMTVIYSFIIAGCLFGFTLFLLGSMAAGAISNLSNAATEEAVLELVADLAPIRTQQLAVQKTAVRALEIAGRLTTSAEDLSGRIEQAAQGTEALKEIANFAGANAAIDRIITETANGMAQSIAAMQELSQTAEELNSVVELLTKQEIATPNG
jgi:methyl-accepting chemotaxis protein